MSVLLEYKIAQQLEVKFSKEGKLLHIVFLNEGISDHIELVNLKISYFKYSQEELLDLIKKYAPEKLI